MVDNSQMTFQNAICPIKIFYFLFQISNKIVAEGLIEMAQLMVGHWTSGKPLPDPLMTNYLVKF